MENYENKDRDRYYGKYMPLPIDFGLLLTYICKRKTI